ncbi:MAG: FtsW/RodA/SpoVE family cell cycle protein [Actinomycetota bacterium]|nr:FtsW/RodA/SpoVE family cell cycle protein [Actinomycetota bacterium]
MATASPLARARRSTELSLVVMAGMITAGAYTLASLGQYTQIPARIIPFLLTLLGMLIVAHLGVRWFARGSDPTLLPVVALLHGLGYVMITRLEPERLAGLQTTWSIIAIVVFAFTLAVVQRAPDLARYRWTFLALGVALLVMPLVPGLGSSFGGARIWVSLGPINFQPGEFAKIALAIFFASYLADNRQLISGATWRVGPLRLPEPRYLLPVLGAWAFAVLVMVAEKDLGSSLLFFTLFVVMLWVSTERAAYLVIGVVLFGAAAFVSWRLFAHVQLRVDIWLDPWADPNDDGYQLVQALYGVSDGGLMGTGLGRGSPDIVPVAESDFIFTSIGEELGLFGGAAILMSYLLMVGAGLRIALRTENAFEKLLAVGLTTIMGMQAFIIVGGVIKLVPLTGITLPFVSYGGSSLVSNYVLLALLVRLSDSTARRLHEVPDDPTMAERWAARRLRRSRHSQRSPATQAAGFRDPSFHGAGASSLASVTGVDGSRAAAR